MRCGSKALQRADSGTGANWTADLIEPPLSVLCVRSARPLGSARARVLDEASPVAEPLITRDEVVALLFNVSDISASAYGIEKLLEDDDGEQEADEG
jgi:hypothetical protein